MPKPPAPLAATWFQTKGPYYPPWEIPIPRDNWDITSTAHFYRLTEPERRVESMAARRSEKSARTATLRKVHQAIKPWRIPQQFTFYCLYGYQGDPVDSQTLRELVRRCFPLERDRAPIVARVRELCAEGPIVLDRRTVAHLLGKSPKTVDYYVRRINDDLPRMRSALRAVLDRRLGAHGSP